MATLKYPEPLVFGLDIGTRSIVGTVGYKEKDKFNVIAMAVKYHDSRAMIDGQIHDIGKVSEGILAVKNELEEKLNGRKLKEVCIAAAGRVLKTAVGHGDYEFEENTLITQEYIHSIDLIGVEQAHNIVLKELEQANEKTKYYCVGYTVIKYYLNDYEILNLEGHRGNKISADVLATFLPEEVVSSLYTAVEQAGLLVTNLTLEPIAAIDVAIPEHYRLLNIALIDVGAGTSDICITKDGSIVGYGMIPSAGDEMTEALIKKYLVDFDTAEMMKSVTTNKRVVTYKDIMGLTKKTTPKEIFATIDQVKKDITKKIADKILELNGGIPISAAFVVGGGGKVVGFTDMLADSIGIPRERVALRGEEVMNDINFLVDDVKKDSLYVTPVGICLNYFDQKNNFIFVTVNKDRIKLYNNDKLTIFDAAVQYGIPNESIFPKRGDDITFKINDKTRIVRGYTGEAAVIKQNGRVVGLNEAIEANDIIEITESTKGKCAEIELSSLPEYSGTLTFDVNNKKITCPKFAVVNGNPEPPSYLIKDGDNVVMQKYYTLEQLLVFLDYTPEGNIKINNKIAKMDDKIYENFIITWSDFIEYNDLIDEEDEIKEKEKVVDKNIHNIHIIVNGKDVIMKGKSNYRFVDIFDFYDFDLSTLGGDHLVTNIDGVHAEYVDPIFDGASVDLFWED